MKKIFFYIFLFIIMFISLNNLNNADQEVMGEIKVYNDNEQNYELLFKDEILNISNFKIKLSMFDDNENYISKVYIKVPNKISDYLGEECILFMHGNNINEKIENLKKDYIDLIRENYLFNELEKFDSNNIEIYKVEVSGNYKTINKFKSKFDKVRVQKINFKKL